MLPKFRAGACACLWSACFNEDCYEHEHDLIFMENEMELSADRQMDGQSGQNLL